MRRLVEETSCQHGYFGGCTFKTDSGEPCPGGTSREVEVDRVKVLDEAIRRLYQSFNPPADMSINEKQAWKEGLYYAAETIAEAVDAALKEGT